MIIIYRLCAPNFKKEYSEFIFRLSFEDASNSKAMGTIMIVASGLVVRDGRGDLL